MADFHTTLFDTWQPGTTALAEAALFQVPQGGDATHTSNFTNSRGAGQLPAEESFLVKRIGLQLDEMPLYADLSKVLFGGVVEIRIGDKVVFSAPARRLVQASGFLGNTVTASAAAVDAMGFSGDGFTLEVPIVLAGGKRFVVNCKQGVALSTAIDLKVVLEGILTIAD